jgi:hypothetical protein
MRFSLKVSQITTFRLNNDFLHQSAMIQAGVSVTHRTAETMRRLAAALLS